MGQERGFNDILKLTPGKEVQRCLGERHNPCAPHGLKGLIPSQPDISGLKATHRYDTD